MGSKERIWMDLLIYAVPVTFLLIFLAYPLIGLIIPAFTTDSGTPTFFGILDVLKDERSISIVLFTISQAAISTLATLLLAFPGAYLLSRYRFPGRPAVLSITTVPFVLPPLVLGIGFMSIFGTQGILQNYLDWMTTAAGADPITLKILYTKEAIVLAHIFLNFPIALRILNSRFRTMDSDIINASRSLGAGPMRTFIRIIIPQMKYSIISAASLIFTFCLLTFGVVLVVGGMSNATIELEIYRQYTGLFDDTRAGALLSVEIFLVAISTAVYLWSSRRSSEGSVQSRGKGIFVGRIGKRVKLKHALVAVYILLILLFIIGPMAAVVKDSFVMDGQNGEHFTLHWFERMMSRENDPTIGVSPMGAVLNSLLFAFLTVVLAVPMAVATAYAMDRRKFLFKGSIDGFLLFPMGVSTVALGLGMVKGFEQGWLDISNSWIPILIVHTLIAYPLGARAILSVKRSIPDDLVKAARSLGASRIGAFFSIELPLLMPGILIAIIFAFAISIGEFGATLMVSSPEYTTMPLALYGFIAGGRDFGSATAYATVLMVVTFGSIFLVDFFGRRTVRGEVGF